MKNHLDAIRTFLKIAELVQKAHLDPDFDTDPNVRLSVYREARKLVRHWLEHAEHELRKHGLLAGDDTHGRGMVARQSGTGILSAFGKLVNTLLQRGVNRDTGAEEKSDKMSSMEVKMLKEMHSLMVLFLEFAEGEIARLERSLGRGIRQPQDGQGDDNDDRRHRKYFGREAPTSNEHILEERCAGGIGKGRPDPHNDEGASGTAMFFTPSVRRPRRLSPEMQEKYANWPGGPYWTIYKPIVATARPVPHETPARKQSASARGSQRSKNIQERASFPEGPEPSSSEAQNPGTWGRESGPPSMTSVHDFALRASDEPKNPHSTRQSSIPRASTHTPRNAGARQDGAQETQPAPTPLRSDGAADEMPAPPTSPDHASVDQGAFGKSHVRSSAPRFGFGMPLDHNEYEEGHPEGTVKHGAGSATQSPNSFRHSQNRAGGVHSDSRSSRHSKKLPKVAQTSGPHKATGGLISPSIAPGRPTFFGTTPETNSQYAWRPPATVGTPSDVGSQRSRVTLAQTMASNATSQRTLMPENEVSEVNVPSTAPASRRSGTERLPSHSISPTFSKASHISDIEQAMRESMKSYTQSVRSQRAQSMHDSGYHTFPRPSPSGATAAFQTPESNTEARAGETPSIGPASGHKVPSTSDHGLRTACDRQTARTPSVLVTAPSDQHAPSAHDGGAHMSEASSDRPIESQPQSRARVPTPEQAFVPPFAGTENAQSPHRGSTVSGTSTGSQQRRQFQQDSGSCASKAPSMHSHAPDVAAAVHPVFEDATSRLASPPNASPEVGHVSQPRSQCSERVKSTADSRASRTSATTTKGSTSHLKSGPAFERATHRPSHGTAMPLQADANSAASIQSKGRVGTRPSSRVPSDVPSAVNRSTGPSGGLTSMPEGIDADRPQQAGEPSIHEDGISTVDTFADYQKPARPKKCHHEEDLAPSVCSSPAYTEEIERGEV